MNRKTSDFDYVTTHVRQIIFEILNHPNNGFEKREYRAVCSFLSELEDFRVIINRSIRIGIREDLNSGYVESVINHHVEYLTVGEEGVEYSYGSDSFERNYNIISYNDLYSDDQSLDIDYRDFERWFQKMAALLMEDEIKICIENSDPYFVFKNY